MPPKKRPTQSKGPNQLLTGRFLVSQYLKWDLRTSEPSWRDRTCMMTHPAVTCPQGKKNCPLILVSCTTALCFLCFLLLWSFDVDFQTVNDVTNLASWRKRTLCNPRAAYIVVSTPWAWLFYSRWIRVWSFYQALGVSGDLFPLSQHSFLRITNHKTCTNAWKWLWSGHIVFFCLKLRMRRCFWESVFRLDSSI